MSITFSAKAEKVKVMLDFRHFYAPEQGNYIETMMHFGGYSMKYRKNEDGILQGKLFITQIFRLGDSIVSYKKYEILTPEVKDSVYSDFYDIQRFPLAPGDYTYEITITDALSKSMKDKEIHHVQPLEVLDYGSAVTISRPQYIEDLHKSETPNMFSKSGWDIIPYISDYFPSELNRIPYYSEIYFPNDSSQYVLKQSIQNFKDETIVDDLFRQKRIDGSKVVPIINSFDISKLPSGNYYLTIEVVDRNNKTVSKKREFFQRSNPFMTVDPEMLANLEVTQNFKRMDSIMYFVEALIPITKNADQKNILGLLKSKDTSMARKYFYSFWKKTEPTDPWFGFVKYRNQVYRAEVMYGTNIRRGFQSDRGRVFLQYGAPNSVLERQNEPNSYPYEIWHYYEIDNQSNRKFIFYNPSLVNGYYELLHSDMFGELQNKGWESDLRNRNTSPGQRQSGTTKDTYGGNAGDWYENDY
jgi:GWxTD domain-containing protein